jgi:hypothetical protein
MPAHRRGRRSRAPAAAAAPAADARPQCEWCAKSCGNAGALGTHKTRCRYRPGQPVAAANVDPDFGQGGMDMGDDALLDDQLDVSDVQLDEPVYAPVPLHVLLDLDEPVARFADVEAMHDRVREEQDDAGVVPLPANPIPASSLLPPLDPRPDLVSYINSANSERLHYDPLLRLTEGMDKGLIRILDTLWSPQCDLGVKGCEAVVDLLRSEDLPPRLDIPSYANMRKQVEQLCERVPEAYYEATCNLDEMGWTRDGGERTFRYLICD